VISQTSVPAPVVNNAHAVNVARTNVTPANTIHNITSSIAEQKPLTVVHNGSAHGIQVSKDGQVIPQQGLVVKHEGSVVGANQFMVKQAIKAEPNAGVTQSVAHTGALVNTTLKGVVTGGTNPSIITVRPQHVAVVQQPTSVTTQASLAQPMQVVNVSGVQGVPRLAGISPTVRPAQGLRVNAPVRITQQPTIAPRQPGAAATGVSVYVLKI
jgi:hypothetical protein